MPNMHFDLKAKSLAMTDLEVAFLIPLRSFHVLSSPPLPRRKAPLTAVIECSTSWQSLQLGGLGERSSSLSGSGRSPAVKRFWCIIDLKMKSGESISSLSGPGEARPPNMHFDLKTKSLADLEISLLIHLRPFHVLPPAPFLAAKHPNCGWRVSPSMAPTAASVS